MKADDYKGPGTAYTVGPITFTNGQGVHALRHFEAEYPKMTAKERAVEGAVEGMMGGFLTHAMGWPDSRIEALNTPEGEADRDALWEICRRLVHTYHGALAAGLLQNTHASQS